MPATTSTTSPPGWQLGPWVTRRVGAGGVLDRGRGGGMASAEEQEDEACDEAPGYGRPRRLRVAVRARTAMPPGLLSCPCSSDAVGSR